MSYVLPDKSKVEILQTFVAFSEYIKFKLEKGGAQSQIKAKLFQGNIFFHELIPSLSTFVNTKTGNQKTQPTNV